MPFKNRNFRPDDLLNLSYCTTAEDIFESYNEHTCQTAGVHYRFIQDNQALSSGLRRRPRFALSVRPHLQAKIACAIGNHT